MPHKVLHLISSPYGLGGAEKLLLDMAEFYDDRQFSISYCNLFDSPQKTSLFSKALKDADLPRFEIRGCRWYDFPKIVSRLAALVKDNNIDIVHTHLIHASIIGGLAKKLEKKHRTVITQHYTQSAHNKFYLKSLDRQAARRADRVIAISTAVKDDLLSYGVDEDKIRLVPNGINLTEFDKTAERENDLLDDLKRNKKYIIGSVGGLHKRKDHLTLIRAMARVIKKFPQVHLVIVGEGKERLMLENTIKETGVEKNVSLAGFQSNISALIKDFDLYVHPSKFEPFGIAILEAMASRKGVIATKVDGVVDIIENGADGFLIPAQNPQIMADFIFQAIENPQRMAEMGQKGRKKVEDSFRIEDMTGSYQKVYTELVSQKVIRVNKLTADSK